MISVFNSLLIVHITSGFTALTAAAGALLATKGAYRHRLCGKIFLYAMTGIFVTAIPMCYLTRDLFLFLIALFSYYFALSGYFYARNPTGIATSYAWTITIIMFWVALYMISYSLSHLHTHNYQITVLLIFGVLGCLTSIGDLKTYYFDEAVGNFRIIKHLTAMLGATIATCTAFTVVNFHTNPAYIAWIAPTIVIVPAILYWQQRVRKWQPE